MGLVRMGMVRYLFFFFSSRRRHTRCGRDWSSDVCSSDLNATEVVIDENTANDEGFSVGDTIGVEIDGPVRQFQIAGIAKYAGVSSIGSATIAAFTPSAAQTLFGKEGKVDVIRVQSKAGVPTSKLLSEI